MGWLAAAKKIFLTVALAANYEIAPPGIDAAKFPAFTRPTPGPRASVAPPRLADFGERLDGAAAKALDNAKLAAFPRYGALVATLERDLKELAPRARFPREWLRSKHARFRRIGEVRRPDRRPFTPDACGEFREIFRLFNSRTALPLTVDVVYAAPRKPGDPKCEASTTPDFARPPLRIELNVQYAHSSAATSASSLLRVFVFDGDRLIAATLENTPKPDKASREKLLAFLKRPENIRRLDEGTLDLPREFLADRALLPGRPFSQIFTPSDFVGAALPSRRYITTPARYLRRLDELSCQGCHSTRSIAGFHFLGADDELFHAASPHGRDEKIAENPPFVARPISGRGRYGDLCVYDDWTCGEGLECRDGECVGKRGAVGEACPCVDTAACRTAADGFPGTACVGRGTFKLCLGERFGKTARACADVALGECSATEGCRAEYVCVRAPGGRGVCVPPLLLPPLNVSEHAGDDPAT